MPKRFVSWAAVSSLPQAKKISIDDQLQINREHAARHDGTIVAELVVPGESRSIVLFEDAARRIDAYARLKELIDARAFDVLVYLDSSRLGRIGALVMSVRALCAQADIICYETDNPPPTLDITASYDDDLLSAIKAVGAQQEVRKFLHRSKSGKIGRAKAGKMQAAAPFGYVAEYAANGARVEPTYTISEPAASTVRRIFAMFLDGRGHVAIARALTDDGVTSPAGLTTWSKASIPHILNRVWTYAGFAEANRKSPSGRPYLRAHGTWPPIIDEATAQRVVDERAARVANRHLSDTKSILVGVCVCAECGRDMHISFHRKRGSEYQWWYARCVHHASVIRIGYKHIVDFLAIIMADLRHADLDALAAADDDTPHLQAQIARHEAALLDIAARLRQADTRYIDGTLDADRYTYQLDRLTAQRAQVEAELNRLRDAIAREALRSTRHERLQDASQNGLDMLRHPDTAHVNAWLRRVVRVYIGRDGIDHAEWL